jgi:hypothetical protein
VAIPHRQVDVQQAAFGRPNFHTVRADGWLTRKLGGWGPCDCQTIGVEIGRVRYARNGDVRLAYRILGDGDTTLVWVPGWVSNVDLLDEPGTPFSAFFEQLADETRFIAWDKRGTGLSDPVRPDEVAMPADRLGIDFSAYVAERTQEFDGQDWVLQAIHEWLADPRGLLHGP